MPIVLSSNCTSVIPCVVVEELKGCEKKDSILAVTRLDSGVMHTFDGKTISNYKKHVCILNLLQGAVLWKENQKVVVHVSYVRKGEGKIRVAFDRGHGIEKLTINDFLKIFKKEIQWLKAGQILQVVTNTSNAKHPSCSRMLKEGDYVRIDSFGNTRYKLEICYKTKEGKSAICLSDLAVSEKLNKLSAIEILRQLTQG